MAAQIGNREYAALRDAGSRADPLDGLPPGRTKRRTPYLRNMGKWTSIALRFDTGSRISEPRKSRTVTPTNDRKSAERHTAFLVMAILITMGILWMVVLLPFTGRKAVQTGDIIAFPVTRVPSVIAASFTARRAFVGDDRSCVLDVRAMQKLGGSLVVESSQLEPEQLFRVHWAGVRTSRGHDDCGSSADLLLNSNQISTLIFEAGGTGVEAQN